MKKIIALVLLVVLVVGLCACGSDKGGVAGHYTLTRVEEAGQLLYSREISGEDFWLELKSDGTGTLCAIGGTNAMGWADGKIWPQELPDDTADLIINGKSLKIQADDLVMVFEKN